MIGKSDQIKTIMVHDYWERVGKSKSIYHSLSESIHDTLAELGRVDVIQITPMTWKGMDDTRFSALITYIPNDTIAILNGIDIVDWSSSGGTLEYMNIINCVFNIDTLLTLGVPYEVIAFYTSDSGDYIDIAPFIFKYTEANWFDGEEGFIIKDEKEGEINA